MVSFNSLVKKINNKKENTEKLRNMFRYYPIYNRYYDKNVLSVKMDFSFRYSDWLTNSFVKEERKIFFKILFFDFLAKTLLNLDQYKIKEDMEIKTRLKFNFFEKNFVEYPLFFDKFTKTSNKEKSLEQSFFDTMYKSGRIYLIDINSRKFFDKEYKKFLSKNKKLQNSFYIGPKFSSECFLSLAKFSFLIKRILLEKNDYDKEEINKEQQFLLKEFKNYFYTQDFFKRYIEEVLIESVKTIIVLQKFFAEQNKMFEIELSSKNGVAYIALYTNKIKIKGLSQKQQKKVEMVFDNFMNKFTNLNEQELMQTGINGFYNFMLPFVKFIESSVFFSI